MSKDFVPNAGNQIQQFRKALIATKLLQPDQIDSLMNRLNANSRLSPITALTETGLCDQQAIDLVEFWMQAQSNIPGYELIDLIGRGGMGGVWRAKQLSLDRTVAMKVISATQDNHQTLVARFEREAAAIAKLSHPNVVTALDFGSFRNRMFLVMEYVAGEDLGQYVDRVGSLSESLSLRLIRQIATGLWHASRHGIIHRDIKPANILLVDHQETQNSTASEPIAKITDFGLAMSSPSNQVPDPRLTIEQSTVGSPHYMAPDQLNGVQLDSRTDIYSLGATLFHLLMGRAPWDGESLSSMIRDKLAGVFPIDKLVAAGVSSQTIELVRRMTDTCPDNRPASCQELLNDIDELIADPSTKRENSELDKPFATNILKVKGVRAKKRRDEALELTQPIRRSPKNVDQNSELVANQTQPVEPDSQAQRFSVSRMLRYWWLIGLIVVLLMVAASALRAPSQTRLATLVLAGEQRQLFNAINIPLDALTEGELTPNRGRIEFGESRVSLIGFRIPDWEFFKFEASVEVPPGATLDVAIGSNIVAKRTESAAVRFSHTDVSLGRLTHLLGEFATSNNLLTLDLNRTAHYLEIEQNRGNWVVRINRDFENQFVIPIVGIQEALEITFVAHPLDQTNEASINQPTAIAELIISKMQLAD